MKYFYILIVMIIFHSCSFDNKTGIWKNENTISKKDKNLFEDFKTLSSLNKPFDKIIKIDDDFNVKIDKPKNNLDWKDIYFKSTNNFNNFTYKNLNQQFYKSKSLTKSNVNKFLLLEKNNLIASDDKGNLIVYSVDKNIIILKYNFYKKKFKKIIKKLNLIVEDNIIYVSDNLGYLYAFDIKKNKILWAKNYKIPFRSNLKIFGDKLMASNQNNNLYFFNKKTGDLIKLIPTEETVFKNKFSNNLSLNKKTLFFINTYGSLYSIDIETMKLKWFVNLNQSSDINPSNKFAGVELVAYGDKILASSKQFTYIIDANIGKILHKKNFSLLIKPTIQNNFIFLITKNDLLILMNITNGNIIYSYNLNQQIANFLNVKKKKAEFKELVISNNKIIIFLKNSYVLQHDINGVLNKVSKLPSKIYTQPLFRQGSILYLSNKNKLYVSN